MSQHTIQGRNAVPSFSLSAYMDDGIRDIIRIALKASLRNPREASFLLRQLWGQRSAARRRAEREAGGRHIPPFLIASIADRCNLHCAGCYFHANQQRAASSSSAGRPSADSHAPTGCAGQTSAAPLTAERWGELFREAGELGIGFILLAGGEPLLNRPVLEAAAQTRRVIFPVFTNGTLFDEAAVALFDRNRCLVPVFSIEGEAAETDLRRGQGIHAQALAAMARLRQRGILLGASITVTVANCDAVTNPAFIDQLVEHGCRVIFWVEYVPVTESTRSLAPGEPERQLLARRADELRRNRPGVIILSFPGDEQYSGGCLAAGHGFFHINASGGAEPCPFSPFSDTSLRHSSLAEALDSPLFRKLSAGGLLLEAHDGGCLLFTRESAVRALLDAPLTGSESGSGNIRT